MEKPLASPQTTLRIQSPGLFTTVQDFGRIGFQQYGMPEAGAMDRESYLLGQALVGNISAGVSVSISCSEKIQPAGALECTILPPTILCKGNCIVAFSGADMSPKINDTPVPLYTPLLCCKGDIISGEVSRIGVRMYISFHGGIDVPLINNSVSTHSKAGIGGYKNRALQEGDTLLLGRQSSTDFSALYEYNPALHELTNRELLSFGSRRIWHNQERLENAVPIRVILGPQESAFTEEGIKSFTCSTYAISPASDRMGFRLTGRVISHKNGADIISDGTVFGSIQVPADGQPIILMADRQPSGGYTKIATVITPDLPLLSQLPIGSRLRFTVVGIDEGHRIYKEYQSRLRQALLLAAEQCSLVWRAAG